MPHFKNPAEKLAFWRQSVQDDERAIREAVARLKNSCAGLAAAEREAREAVALVPIVSVR